MRNVRSALLVAAVGVMGLTACSFSSSRSWGSGNSANPNTSGTGKPAQRSSGKPAKKVVDNSKPAAKPPAPAPAPVVEPKPAPAPAPTPAAEPDRVGRDDTPARVGRDDEPSPASIGVSNTTLGAKPTKPDPKPVPSGTIGVASSPGNENPGNIKAAPVKPTTPSNKAAK